MNSTRSTCLIADDEPHLVKALQAQLATLWPELDVVAIARNGIEAAERIAALQPDLAFLDIQMPGLTGLEVAQGIEGSTRVVFVTAYDAYAVEAFEQEALDYVLKPVKAEHLIRTPIAELAAQLDPAQFCQVHRSTIVNLRHLDGTRRDEASRLFVRIKGGPGGPGGSLQELPVSRAYVHLFKAM